MKSFFTLILWVGSTLFAAAQPLPTVPGMPNPNPGLAPQPSKIAVTYFPYTDANTYATVDTAIIPVILAYARLNEPALQADQLSAYFTRNNNPFLEPLAEQLKALRKAGDAQAATTGAQGGGSGMNLFSANAIIDGLGTFLADRFKKELTIAYLDQMQKQIGKADEMYAVSSLLPKTYSTFDHLQEVFNYQVYLNTLRESAKQDIYTLPDQVFPFADALYQKGRITGMEKNDFYTLLYGSYLFKESAYKGQNLLLLLTRAKENEYLLKADTGDNTRNTLLFLGGMMSGYQKSETNFIGMPEINTLHQSPRTRELFLGLMLEKIRQDIAPLHFTTNAQQLSGTELYIAYGQDVQFLFQVLTRVDRVRADLQAIRDLYVNKDSSGKVSYYLTLVQDFRMLLQQLQKLPGNLELKPYRAGAILALADETLELTQYIMQKQPGIAVSQLLVVMDSLHIADTTRIYKFTEKYGPFIASLAEAQNGDDVAAALDAAAMPVGSFRVKHNYRQNIAIQAYVGLSGSCEMLRVNNSWEGKFVPAFAAPVGVSWSFTHVKKGGYELGGYTHSVFLSVLDIGAVTALRITDSTTSLPELTFKNVLAPGLYYVGSFKKTPICFGLGAQYGPELRKIEQGNAVLNASGFRFGGFIAVDIPVFNIYNRGIRKDQ